MAVGWSHVLSQGPVLRALGGVALRAIANKRGSRLVAPSPWLERELPPRPTELTSAFVRAAGGDAAWYRGVLPASLFPQWGLALGAELMRESPYPLARALNAGCSFTQRAPLPLGEPLEVRARLASVDDDGARAILEVELETATKSAPRALTSVLRTFVPLGKGRGRARRPRALVPESARELSYGRLREDAGLDFAKLTGDFNPIHWIPAAARAAGFAGVILHGFATMARAVEGLNRGLFAGDPARLAHLDVRFVLPLVLPRAVGVYVDDGGLWVGDAPQGAAYLEGRFETHARSERRP